MNVYYDYTELVHERFGDIPWGELYRRPRPLIKERPCGPDEPKAIAARRRALVLTLDGRDGNRPPTKEQQ